MYMQSHSHCFNACLKGRFFNIMESKEYLKRSDTDDDARIDWGIIFCVLVLAVIGMTALYVALSHDNIVNPTKVLFRCRTVVEDSTSCIWNRNSAADFGFVHVQPDLL